MTDAQLRELIDLMRRTKTDLRHVEAKRARGGLPQRLWETLSAYANSPGGGVIILGLDESSKLRRGRSWGRSKNPPRLGQHDSKHGTPIDPRDRH